MFETLSRYSLDPLEYSNLLTISGVIEKSLGDNRYIIITDDVKLPVIFHPSINDEFNLQQFSVEENDDVDLLGCYINIDNKPEILVLRCVVYEEPPRLIS